MAAFEVQTTEIHLLLNPAQISVRAKQFQLKVKRQSDGLDITSGAGVTYSSASAAIATVDPATGLIQAVALGETYCRMRYLSGVQESSMIIRVVVHADIASASGQYLIYNGDQRITTYKSRQTADDEFSIYYTPTVYAKFTDGLFGDISCHPYLKYDEVNTNGTPLASTPSLLAIDKELFPGSTTEYYYPGLFRCMTAGPVLANMGTHRGLKITLQGIGTMVTDTSKLVGIRCEDELDKPRFLLRRVNNDVLVPDGPLTQVLFLGEGYDTASQAKFLAHCQDMITFIQKQPPYNLLKDSMEFWYAPDASGEVGVTVPSYVNVDGGQQTKRLIPGGFNYFYEYGNAVKQLIAKKGIYKGTNDSDGTTFFTDNSGIGGVTHGLDQVKFMENWRSTKLEGFVRNKDTRLCMTLGEGRLSEVGSQETALPTSNFGYWLNYPDTYDVAFDRRKTFMKTSGKSSVSRDYKRLFINTYIGSLREVGLTDPNQGIKGDLWTNIDRSSMYRRTFVVILVNHPMEIGVNSNNYCVTTVADNQWLEVGSPQNGVLYPETVTTDNKSVSLTSKITFAHELTHFFNIGDEYSDVRSQGHENFTPSESLYSSRIARANIDSFERLKLDGTTANEINPYKVKWNWPRIATASATLNRPEVSSGNQIVLNLISAAEATKWSRAMAQQTNVYLRTIDFPLYEQQQIYDFITLGEGDIFRLRVTAINSGPTLPYSVTLTILPQGTATIAQCAAVIEDRKKYFRGEACLYAKQKGLYRVQSVKLKTGVTQPGAIFQTSKEGQNLKLSIRGTVPSSKYALNIILKIKPDGTCEDAFLDPKEKKMKSSRKTVFIDNDQNIADTGTWDAGWFQASSTPIQHPILDFEFVPYDTSLSRINVIDPGNGYTADPVVNITPANGAVAKAVLGAQKVFAELDPGNNGGNFIFPVYLEAIDLRNKDENQKGSGLLALVTELDSNGAIVNYSIVNNGNGLYSSNAAETQIKITTDGHDYIGATTAAEFVFDPVAYQKWIKSTSGKNIVGWEGTGNPSMETVPGTNPLKVIYYCPIKYKMAGNLPKKGAGYQIPLGPMRFSLSKGTDSAPEVDSIAHVLGYLNNNQLEKVEILFAGKGYTKNQILNIRTHFANDVFYIHKHLHYYYRHNVYNEAVPSGSDYNENDTMPVFEVLDVDGDGGITQLGFYNNQKGNNLHYPTQPLTAVVSAKGTFDGFLNGFYGKYDFSFAPQPATPANARAISKVNLVEMARAEVTDKKIRVFGGKPTVTTPGVSGVSIPCDTTTNVASILEKQGKSLLEIQFVNNQRGSGFTEANPPAVSLSGGAILAGGAPATIQVELSLFPRIVDPSILKYMEQHKAPLIASQDVASVGNALKQIFSDAATDSITLQNKNQEALIAIYEGAATFNKKAYRPSFDSLMRNSSRTDSSGKVSGIIPMNFVTMYYLVNYLNASKLGDLDHDQYFNTISYTVK